MVRRASERRKHTRHALACPVSLSREDEKLLAQSKTVNISDGGALVAVPSKSVPRLDQKVALVFSVPRSTANTYMLEEFTGRARIVRHQPLTDNDQVGVAIQFLPAMSLGLEA
ncbi:MAG TPA: PilZ domain-containing protein [Phycisphaerae bacterium]|nr:PilZ domain-containing protein [Phycisphaerae bacterium]